MTARTWVSVERRRLRLGTADGDRIRWAREVARGDGEIAEEVARLLGDPDAPAPGRVGVLLRPPAVQVRTVRDLPPVKGPDLVQLVDQQRTRLFRPVSGTPVVGATWIEDDDGRSARAALAERELLEAVESAVAASDGSVASFVVPIDDGESFDPAAEPLTLTTPSLRRRESGRRRRRWTALVVLALSGWIAAGATYAVDLVRDDRTLRHELAQLQVPLARIDSIESRLAAFVPLAEAVRRQGEGSAWAHRRLRGLAAALPGDAHLHRVAMERGGSVTVEAHGADPVAVIDSLSDWWSGPVRLADRDGEGRPFTLRMGPPR